jgi:hypothetical protein
MSDFEDGGKAWPFGDKRANQIEMMKRNKSVNCSHKKTQAHSDGFLLDWLEHYPKEAVEKKIKLKTEVEFNHTGPGIPMRRGSDFAKSTIALTC